MEHPQKSSSQSNNPHPSFRVQSCWSQAGVGTCFVLEQQPKSNKSTITIKKRMRIVLDLGCTPIFNETIRSNIVILTHGHLDHVAGVFGHARAHSIVCGGSIPTYYVPSALAPILEKARDCFSDMDGLCQSSNSSSIPNTRNKSLLKMKIIPVTVGQEIEIKQTKVRDNVRFYLHPFSVSHGGHPSLGYTIVSRQISKSLKQEYKDLTGKELSKLVKSGTEITITTLEEQVEVCYTGDSCVDGLVNKHSEKDLASISQTIPPEYNLSLQYLKQGFTSAPLLLCELTFLDPLDQEKAKEKGHLNVADIKPLLMSHGWNIFDDKRILSDRSNQTKDELHQGTIIFFHVSCRHGPAERVLQQICDSLPKNVLERSDVAISSFLGDRESDLLKIMKQNGCISLTDYLSYRETNRKINEKP